LALSSGTTGSTPPRHESGSASDGSVTWEFKADESIYLLRLTCNGTAISENFQFYGVRIENRSSRAKLIKVHGTTRAVFSTVTINGLYLGADRDAANKRHIDLLDSGATVIISNSRLASLGKIFRGNASDAAYFSKVKDTSLIQLTNCYLTKTVLETNTWVDNSVGRLRSEGCKSVLPASIVSETEIINAATPIADADIVNPLANREVAYNSSNAQRNGKVVFGNIRRWPDLNTAAQNWIKIELPLGAIIESIVVRKAPRTGDGTTYQLEVVNGDGSYTYGQSALGAGHNLHEIILHDIYRRVTTEVDRIVWVRMVTSLTGTGRLPDSNGNDLFFVRYL